jgi:hypothetical protein
MSQLFSGEKGIQLPLNRAIKRKREKEFVGATWGADVARLELIDA